MRTLLILITSLYCFSSIKAQNLDETFRLADALYAAGAEQEADLLFQRAIFFGYGKYDDACFERLAEINWRREDYHQAAIYFNGAIAATTDISKRNHLLIRRANSLLLLGELQLSMQDLFGLSDQLPDSIFRRQQFLLGTIYFIEKDFQQSAQSLKACFEKEEDKKLVEEWVNAAAAIKHPNPQKARKLSKYLPGLGQFYAGDIKNGVNSLLLATFFVYTIINTALTYSYIEAALTIAPWLQRYYQGGFTRAEGIAQRRLNQKQHKYYDRVVKLLESAEL